MLVKQVPPAAVTKLAGFLRRADDVCEQHGGQAAVRVRRPAGPVRNSWITSSRARRHRRRAGHRGREARRIAHPGIWRRRADSRTERGIFRVVHQRPGLDRGQTGPGRIPSPARPAAAAGVDEKPSQRRHQDTKRASSARDGASSGTRRPAPAGFDRGGELPSPAGRETASPAARPGPEPAAPREPGR